MRSRILFSVLVLIIVSCSGGGNDGGGNTTNPTNNQPPSKVGSLVAPENNLLCTTKLVTFQWTSAADPEGKPLKYVLEISTDNGFSTLAENITTFRITKAVNLEKGMSYYWRVKAIDDEGASSEYSAVYSFYTEGEGETNHLPFQPQVVSPQMDSFVDSGSITLEWSASDVDKDPLTFDVYLDETNPPTTKVGEDLTDKLVAVATQAGTTYYWKVDVKDTKSGKTNGQVWSFMTN